MNDSLQPSEPERLANPSVRHYLSKILNRIVKNSYLNILVGTILIVMSADDVWKALSDGFDLSDLGSDTGIVLVGLMHIFKAIPEVLEGLEHLENGKDHQKSAAQTEIPIQR